MKRAIVVLSAAVVVGLGTTAPATAHTPCADTGMPGHSDYGRSHVASHTPHGHGVGAHNPGTHQGYAECNPNTKHFGTGTG